MKKIVSMFSFSGRAKRAKFLQFLPIALLVWLGAAYLDETYIAPNLCEFNEDWICYLPGEVREGVTFDKIIGALLLIPFFAVLVKRLHDHDRSGIWALLAIPLIGMLYLFLYPGEIMLENWQMIVAAVCFLPLLFWMLTKGNKEPNRYG